MNHSSHSSGNFFSFTRFLIGLTQPVISVRNGPMIGIVRTLGNEHYISDFPEMLR